MTNERSVAEQIAVVERKLEIRRERTRRHWDEVQVQAQRSVAWLPLLAAAGALVLGIVAGRRSGTPSPTPARKTGLFATLAALGMTAFRLASSPAGRALWSALRSARPR